MEKVEKYILEYQKKVKNCKYKVSVADYEAAYHDAKVDLDNMDMNGLVVLISFIADGTQTIGGMDLFMSMTSTN